MNVTIPVVVLLGLLVVLAVRFLKLRLWHAIVCLLCGFLLASTVLAPEIHRALEGLTDWILSR